jgi:phosphatidylserine/phosphatidylglycerophosphate/cardiolipin synthase-like enzyme
MKNFSILYCAVYFFLASSYNTIIHAIKPKIDPIEIARHNLVKGNHASGVFFVPTDPVKKILLGLIYNEKKSIRAAQFRITDKDLEKALEEAHNRGVEVSLVTDQSCLQERSEKVSVLHTCGIDVRIYAKPFSIMHHKYWIFGENFFNAPLLMFGSANGSQGGLTRNHENVIVTGALEIIESYRKNFYELKKISVPLANYRAEESDTNNIFVEYNIYCAH